MGAVDESIDQGQLTRIREELSKGIPLTWSLSTLGEPFKWGSGGTPRSGHTQFYGGEIPWLVIGDLTDGVVNDSTTKITELGLKSSSAKLVDTGAILLAMYGSIGKLGIAGMPLATNQAIAFTKTTEIDTLYLFYFLKYARNWLTSLGKGATQQNISQAVIKAFPFVVAPKNEQHRIVAKIEELFSELDKGIENLKTARAQLKVYRQALLKHAFEGKLTSQWREQNKDKLESVSALQQRIQTERAARYQQQLSDWQAAGQKGSKPKCPKTLPPLTNEELAELPVLPNGWDWEKLGNIANLIGGVTKGKDLAGKEKISLPYLRVANVQDGFLDLTEIKLIEVEAQDKNKYKLELGDVLYTEGGDKDKLGRGAVWQNQIELCIHQNHIFRARIYGGLIKPEILSLYSQTKSAKKYFFRHAKQTTNLASINLTVLANLPIAIFSQSEQQQVMLEVESRLSEVDQLEQTIATSLQQSDALHQSILKKAFSGTLVAQDANDEPASVLLARIKAEKATQVVTTKPRKTKKAQALPEPVKTNVIPFPTKIANISASDLHAGLMAMAYQHHEQKRKAWYFGHVKAEKIAHMLEAHLGVDLERNPIKDAAGPNDFQRLLAIEATARTNNWFDVQKLSNGRHMLYKMQGFDDLIKKTSNALGEQINNVNALIALFVPLDKTRSEIVATLYAAWNNLLLLGQKPNDEEIVMEATENWHTDKLKIRRDRFFRCLVWMRGHGLVPIGKGRFVPKKGGKFKSNEVKHD